MKKREIASALFLMIALFIAGVFAYSETTNCASSQPTINFNVSYNPSTQKFDILYFAVYCGIGDHTITPGNYGDFPIEDACGNTTWEFYYVGNLTQGCGGALTIEECMAKLGVTRTGALGGAAKCFYNSSGKDIGFDAYGYSVSSGERQILNSINFITGQIWARENNTANVAHCQDKTGYVMQARNISIPRSEITGKIIRTHSNIMVTRCDNCYAYRCRNSKIGVVKLPDCSYNPSSNSFSGECCSDSRVSGIICGSVCGNSIAETGEECDDGNSNNQDSCIIDNANNYKCKNAVCGDGYLHSGAEQCDDGNLIGGDGCFGCFNELFGGISWRNINNNIILSADLHDTVKLSVQGAGLQQINYTIYKNVAFWFDSKLAQSSTQGYTTWSADEPGTFYFKAMLPTGEEVTSGELEVSAAEDDSMPVARIISPAIDARIRMGNSADFALELADEDDDLNVVWDFGDGNTQSFSSCLTAGNCNMVYNYTSSGTKVIVLRATEQRANPLSNENYTRVFVFDSGVNVFPVINSPEFGRVFLPSEGVVNFRAEESFVAECASGACPQAPCYDIGDLKCRNIHAPNTPDGSLTGYALYFNWSFSEGSGIYGNWAEYDNAVSFSRVFFSPRKHWAKLNMGYEAL